jgi:hypothetical protein
MAVASSCNGLPTSGRSDAGHWPAGASGFDESSDGFIGALVAETEADRCDFLGLPQVRMALSGSLEPGSLLVYLEQAYHIERETLALMEDARGRLSGRPDLADGLDAYISGDADYAETILENIVAIGGDHRLVMAAKPSRSASAVIERARASVRSGNPVALFGLVFVMESLAIASIRMGAEVAARALNLDEAGIQSLLAPGALESQTRFFTGLMGKIIDPDEQGAIIASARDIFRLLGSLFAGLP